MSWDSWPMDQLIKVAEQEEADYKWLAMLSKQVKPHHTTREQPLHHAKFLIIYEDLEPGRIAPLPD